MTPDLWSHLTRAIRAGFAIEFEPTPQGTFIIRYRAAYRNPRCPATSRVRDHAVERRDLEDAFRQVATVTTGELDIDAEEKRARWSAMDEEDRLALLNGTAPATHHERDTRAAE